MSFKRGFDVREYGAVGDGVALDHTAWQSAIDAAYAAGGGVVFGQPGSTYLFDAAASYTANGVTENYGVEVKPGVTIDGSGCKFTYPATAADTVNNQFWFFANKTDAATFDGYHVRNAAFENTGTADAYVGACAVFGGDNAKAAGWLSDVDVQGLHTTGLRVAVKLYQDRSDSTLPIRGVNVNDIRCVDLASAAVVFQGVENGRIDGVDCDGTDFDVVVVFSAANCTVSDIIGKGATENLVLIEPQSGTNTVNGLTISNVRGDTGKMSILTGAGSSGAVRNLSLSNIQVPVFNLDNSAGGGTVEHIRGAGLLLRPGAASRASTIVNASDIDLSLMVDGSPTVEGVLVKQTTRVNLEGSINVDTAVPCVQFDRAAKTTGRLRLIGGTDGVLLTGVNGTMGGLDLEVWCQGQSDKAIDYDGTTSVSHEVHIRGWYDDQPINYGNVAGSTIELQTGFGQQLGIVGDELAAVYSKAHVVTSETGSSDNLQDINSGILGQVVTIHAASGETITLKHATGSGNIRTLTGGDVAVTNTRPATLAFNGANWVQVGLNPVNFIQRDGSVPFTGDADLGGNAITNVGNVDGRDVAADGTKLDGIEAGADVTDATNVAAAGALLDQDSSGSDRSTPAFATEYTPSGTRPTLVVATVTIDCTENEDGDVALKIGGTGATVQVCKIGFDINTDAVAAPTAGMTGTLVGVVPPGDVYELVTTSNTGTPTFTLDQVREVTL